MGDQANRPIGIDFLFWPWWVQLIALFFGSVVIGAGLKFGAGVIEVVCFREKEH